LVWPRHYRHIT